MARKTILLIAVGIILVSLSLMGCKESTHDDPDRNATISYEVLNTVEYSGHAGRFSQQASGIMTVRKNPLVSGDVAYSYAFVADVTADGGRTVGEISSPVMSIFRDPKSDHIVGGSQLLKNLGLVANAALDQVKGQLEPDSTTLTRSFQFNVPDEFPENMSYKIAAKKQNLDDKGEAVAVLALSEPFEYVVPGSSLRVSARHNVLCLLDSTMDKVFYQCSNFTATAPEGDKLSIESLMYELTDNKPISLNSLGQGFDGYFRQLELSEDLSQEETDTGLPLWAMHSLAVRDHADLVAGAAIEGKPNFAICATVGLAHVRHFVDNF